MISLDRSVYWTDEYIEQRLLAGKKKVPLIRLKQYYADKAGLIKPAVCPGCDVDPKVRLSIYDLSKPAAFDNVVYVCRSCLVKLRNHQKGKPRLPGRPVGSLNKKTIKERVEFPNKAIALQVTKCEHETVLGTLDSITVRHVPLPSPNIVRKSRALAKYEAMIRKEP